MKFVLMSLFLFSSVAQSNILSSSDLKKWGVYRSEVSGLQEGYMPEGDGPFGDETPNYWIEYYEKGNTIVFAYAWGWGYLDHEYVFPMHKEVVVNPHCRDNCFNLLDVTSGDKVGYGTCANKPDDSRDSCTLTIFDNGNKEKVELKVRFKKKENGRYHASSLIVTESYKGKSYPSFGE